MAVGYWDAGIPDTLPIYLWYHNIQQYTNYTKKKIVFKQLQYILPNWTGDQYPSVIYLCVENIFGYNDFMGNGTERLAAL